MRSLPIYPYLVYDGVLRHPISFYCQLGFVALLAYCFIRFAVWTPGSIIYFTAAIGLYVTSSVQHAVPFNWRVNFCDQTMIGWYVAATPLPFVWAHWWALPLFGLTATLVVLNKWYEWECDDDDSCLNFLIVGIVSFAQVLVYGLPGMGASYDSAPAFILYGATACFLGKLVVYHSKRGWLIPRVWGPTETGHFFNAIGVSLITLLAVKYTL